MATVCGDGEPDDLSEDDLRALQALRDQWQPRAPNRTPSATSADWSREEPEAWWNPSRRLLRAVRDYSQARAGGGVSSWLHSKAAVARYRFWSAVTGAEIPLDANDIGGGLLMPHPNGVVIHPDASVGPNCLIFQQVTIGTGPIPGVPRIGGHVDIGAGAKILGGVVIGDNAVIGANAVVIADVPAGAIATGIPAVSRPRAPGDPDRPEVSDAPAPPQRARQRS